MEELKSVPFAISSLDPEVASKAQRRKFSGADKKGILEEVDRATGHGAIGAILRRSRAYSSTLHQWRKERDAAVDKALSQKRGPIHWLERTKSCDQNQRLQEKLEKAHTVIDVQKKVAKLLGYPLAEVPSGEK